ncbi:MAG: hemerythrin domain-containing protein [Burkholderiaceae bacterium]
MNIYEELRADHDIQRTLIDLLVKTEGDSEGREELFAKVKTALDSHAMAEERHFYVPLIESDLVQEKARHSIAEHKELDDLVEALETTDRSSPAWLVTARTLKDRLLHHLAEEEHEVFQLSGKVLTETQKQRLASAYRREMNDAG